MGTEAKTTPETEGGDPKKQNEVDPIDAETDLTKLRALAKENAAKLKDAEAKKHEANEEAKKHRLEGKEAKTKAEKFEKAWKLLNGDSDEVPDAAKLEKERSTKQMRNLYLKSAFVSEAAKEMHDADFSFDAVASEFGDVEVDTATGKVDKAAVKKKVEELKKTRPFLFAQPKENDGGKETPKPPPKGHNDGGAPAGAENPWTKWQNLLKTDKDAAQKFYAENRKAIGANMPK